ELALVADRADQRTLGAARDVDFEARGANSCFDGGDLGIAGFGFHHDDHVWLLVKKSGGLSWGRPLRPLPLIARCLRSRASLGWRPIKVSVHKDVRGSRHSIIKSMIQPVSSIARFLAARAVASHRMPATPHARVWAHRQCAFARHFSISRSIASAT